MKKYLAIIGAYWQRGLTYRFTVLSYRIGEIAEMVILFLMWTALYKNQEIIQGFTLREMLTYIIIGNLFRVMVRNFLPTFMANEIKDGKLSMYLVQPIHYFAYTFSRELGRLSFASLISVVSQTFVVVLFHQYIIFNIDLPRLGVLIVMLCLAFFIELLISFLIGCVTFWTDEIDGLFESVRKLERFFAGEYFPLSFLPTVLAQASVLLPFAYSFFIPTQLYLGKITIAQGVQGIIVQLVWIVILAGVVQIVWKKGLKKYEGVGM